MSKWFLFIASAFIREHTVLFTPQLHAISLVSMHARRTFDWCLMKPFYFCTYALYRIARTGRKKVSVVTVAALEHFSLWRCKMCSSLQSSTFPP